jgi:uncharacterized membrane protein YhfC
MNKILLALLLAIMANSLIGRTLLEYDGQENMEKDTSCYEFQFAIAENGNRMVMDLNAELKQGQLNVCFGGAGYQVIGSYIGEGHFRYQRVVFGPLDNREPVIVRVTARHALGKWQLRFREISRTMLLFSLLVSGCLVILLTVAVTLWWMKYSQRAWRWLFVGASVWFVGVVFKFVFASFANAPLLEVLKSSLSNFLYLAFGSVYVGLLTGIFEIGITLVFALLIRQMWESPQNALGIGLGAGLVEAFLIGLSSISSFTMVMVGSASSDAITGALSQAAVVTPLLWLISSVERMIAILCHASSRVLVLFAVARRKQRFFWAGFLILTAIDAIAGYFHLAALVNQISTWWVEFLLLPFAVISIPVIRWCFKNWPSPR